MKTFVSGSILEQDVLNDPPSKNNEHFRVENILKIRLITEL